MKGGIAALFLAGFGTLAQAPSPSRPEEAPVKRTVQDGVFTIEQSQRGEKAFASACSRCHGSDLKGDGVAPALAGSRFISNWKGATVKDLFELIRTSMPPDGQKTVSPETKVDIIAYLLAVNKYPSGQGALEADAKKLDQIRIVPPA